MNNNTQIETVEDVAKRITDSQVTEWLTLKE